MASHRKNRIFSTNVVQTVDPPQPSRETPDPSSSTKRDRPRLVQTPYFWFDTLSLEEFHGLSTYLSSRLRAAGNSYSREVLLISEENRIAFIKHLYAEVVRIYFAPCHNHPPHHSQSRYTTYWGLAKFKFGSTLPVPECLSALARLLLQNETGDASAVAAACANDPYVPDRILPHYYHRWWSPFDLSQNWDGSIDNMIKVYRLQARLMAPNPVPPLVSSYLSDLATEALIDCAKSLKLSRSILNIDSAETLKEMSRTMLLVNQTKVLLEKVRAEENAQARAFAVGQVAEAMGVTAEQAASFFSDAASFN
jgi:hypothetical protein